MPRGKPLSAKTTYGYQPAFHLMRARGISQREAAGHLRMSQGAINGYIIGFLIPPPSVAERLSGLLGEPVENLFSDEVLGEMRAKAERKRSRT